MAGFTADWGACARGSGTFGVGGLAVAVHVPKSSFLVAGTFSALAISVSKSSYKFIFMDMEIWIIRNIFYKFTI